MERHDGHDEILAAGAVVEIRGFHRSGAGDGTLWVVQDVSSGVRAHAIVGARQSQRLLDHGGSTRDTGRRVVFGVRDEGSTNAEHELRVNFAMGVFGCVEQRHIKFRGGDFAVWHGHVGFEMSDIRSRFTEVHPFDVLVLHDASSKASAVAFGNGLRQHKRSRCDIEVFFFLGVNPLDNALDDERAEVDFTAGQLGEVVLREAWSTVVENEQGSKDSTFVGVDEDVLVFHIVTDGDF